MSWQASVPVVALYFPAAHDVHIPSFAVAPLRSVPADALLNSFPGGQVKFVIAVQDLAPELDLYLPAVHNAHAPSFTVEPVKAP